MEIFIKLSILVKTKTYSQKITLIKQNYSKRVSSLKWNLVISKQEKIDFYF